MMHGRWQALMHSLGYAANEAAFEALSAAYAQSHRHYHTARHIQDCLEKFDTIRREAAEPDAIELALWFHDAVYNPYRSGNEQASADWALRFLRENNAPPSLRERVQALILATRHAAIASDRDMAILVDIDLSILGSTADAYEEYRRAVRREYRWVPGVLFRRKRRAMLESLRARERIYLTEYFHSRLEAGARGNIDAELAALR